MFIVIIGGLVATTMMIVAVFMLAMTSYMLESEAQQQQPLAVTPPTDIEVVDSDQITQQIISMLESSRLVDYQLYSNGTAEYTIEFVQPGASQSNWKNFTVITEH